LDFALHCLVEKDLRQSLTKAIRFYGPVAGREISRRLARKWEDYHEKE
jgi:hypothetical protein